MKKIFLFITLFSFFQTFSQVTFLQRFSQHNQNNIINPSRVNNSAASSDLEINSKGDTVIVYDFKFLPYLNITFIDYTTTYRNTPFYNNKWYSSSIFSENGEKVKGVVAYNLQTNSLFFAAYPNTKTIEIKPNEFTLSGKKLKKYKDVYGQAGDVYYEQLVAGDVEVYKQYYCSLYVTNRDGYHPSLNGYDGEFDKESRYFTIYANKMTRIGNNYKVFGLFASQAKAYAKKENLKLTRESDLVKIATYLNELYSKIDVAKN
jgi:hypothetical protein